MAKYVCELCGYVYDEEAGDPDNDIDPGTLWDELDDDFVCPVCGEAKEDFEELEDEDDSDSSFDDTLD